MHPAHTSAVLVAAIDGERVLVVLDNALDLRPLLNEMVGMFDGGEQMLRRVNRTNGGEKIDLHSGGSIRIVARTISIRGNAFDQMFIPIGSSWSLRQEIEPAIATSKVGLITGY